MDRSCHGFHTVVTVHQVFEEATRAGVGPAELRALTGLDPNEVTDFSQRLAADRLFTVWEKVMTRLDDPAFPLRVARGAVRNARSPVTFLALACADVRAAIRSALANVSAWTTAYTIRGVPWEDGLSLVLDGLDPDRLGARCEAEFQIADILASLRGSLGDAFVPPRVAFAHPVPREVGTHRDYFGPGLAFLAPHTEIVIPADVLDRPLSTAQPGLADVLARHLAELRAPHQPPASYRLRLREWLLHRWGDGERPSIAAAAKAFAISERTLHRRLADEGVTFREVCAETRRQLAVDLVRTSPRPLKEIARGIGFADSRSFHRAYLRWTGTTPGHDRLG